MTRQYSTVDEIYETLGSYLEKPPNEAVIGLRETIGEISDLFCIFGGAWVLAGCREAGIDELVRVALSERTRVWTGTAVYVLASLATGLVGRSRTTSCPRLIMEKLQRLYTDEPSLVTYARTQLRDLSVRVDEEKALELLQGGLGAEALHDQTVQNEIVRIFSIRWFTISVGVIEDYFHLISQSQYKESFFQKWFTRYPQMLDPMAASLWPLPNLRGAKKPDFVLQRFDNTYLIVEIKKPTTSLVTADGRISAEVNAALEQVEGYVRYMRKLPELDSLLPRIDNLECLVVAGVEANLSETQVQALRNANSRNATLRTVGYDWLARRAQAINDNLVQQNIHVETLRTI